MELIKNCELMDTTLSRLLRGDRFSIKERAGVYRIDVDEEFGFQGVERYSQADSDPSFEGLAHISAYHFQCERHLVGLLVTSKTAFEDIDFEKLTYDDDLPF